MERLTVALDLEGYSNPRPRPGLRKFLDMLDEIRARVVMMTTVPEPKFREIASGLVDQGFAPGWFAQVDYISWQRLHKSLHFIPEMGPGITCIVDGYPGYVDPY